MTEERFKELMEKDSKGITGDRAFKGLLVIAKYIDMHKKQVITHAEHDKIYSVSVQEIINTDITEDDVEKISAVGWFIDNDTDSLMHYI